VFTALSVQSQAYHAGDVSRLRTLLVQGSLVAGVTNGEHLGLSALEISTLVESEEWLSKVVGVTWDNGTPRRISSISWQQLTW
jgi:hypothetical protein